MKRLTSDRNVYEMGVVELAHNSCYRGEDGSARYKDYDIDIDARALAKKLLKDHVDNGYEFLDDDDFDGWMADFLYDGMDSPEGLIALFYRNLWAMADLRERLKYYEDLEEQGKLLKLPAAMGDEIFFIFMDCPKDYKEEYCRDHKGSCENCHHRVPEIVSKDFQMSDIPNMDKIFATREEAEAALKEMEKNGGK